MRPMFGGRPYVGDFGVDVITGGPLCRPPDLLPAPDLLDFAGIAPPRVAVVPIETHAAEKLHAYTLPRPTPNARVKDLPDLALLSSIATSPVQELRHALELTFGYRGTHPLPGTVPPPPAQWTPEYERLAATNRLPWKQLHQAFAAAGAFLDPVLTRTAQGRWRFESAEWK